MIFQLIPAYKICTGTSKGNEPDNETVLLFILKKKFKPRNSGWTLLKSCVDSISRQYNTIDVFDYLFKKYFLPLYR